MNCLNDFIGLTGCTVATPASGLFINSLPGISLKSIEQLADAEQQTYVGVWNDIQVRAQSRLLMDVRSQFNNRYKIATATKTVVLNNETAYPDGTETNGDGTSYYGIYVDQDSCISGTDYKSSALSGIYIGTITVDLGAIVATATLRIFDADTGEVLHTTAITLSSLTASVNTLFTARRLFIGILPDQSDFTDMPFSDSVNSSCLEIKGGKWNATTNVFTEIEDNTYGLWMTIGKRCSVESLICNNKDVFQYAYWYLLGSELMMERMVSERINKWTIDKQQAEELKAHYDTTYETAIKQAVDGISLNTNDSCIECDPPIAVREARL